jgi:putative DNA primase/helicase
MTRPVPLTVRVEGIPEALRVERRWCLWRYELQGERPTKIPYQVSGRHAKSNDPATWTTFDAAYATYLRGGYDGIEFMLGGGWGGIDVDHTADADAQWFLDKCPGYVERSPSGKGYKVFGRSERIGGQVDFAKSPPAFTTWTSARPFTVTGHGVGDPTADLTAFINDWFPANPVFAKSSGDGFLLAAMFDDHDLAMQMFGADNGDKIWALWCGDLSAHGGDHSRADLALCRHLAFWCNYDMERVERMFAQSKLFREKRWDKTYRTATLAKAAQDE